MAKKKKKIDLSAEASGFGHNPFAAALGSAKLPDAPAEIIEELNAKQTSTPPRPWDLSQSKKLVLRRDAKRRRGRVVTLIEGIDGASKAEIKELARALGKRLGSGATVDSDTVILVQGDHRERLAELLVEHGAKGVKSL